MFKKKKYFIKIVPKAKIQSCIDDDLIIYYDGILHFNTTTNLPFNRQLDQRLEALGGLSVWHFQENFINSFKKYFQGETMDNVEQQMNEYIEQVKNFIELKQETKTIEWAPIAEVEI